MIEKWKDIEGYNGDYQISNLGIVKSFKGKSERIMRLYKRKGYISVSLSKNNKHLPT